MRKSSLYISLGLLFSIIWIFSKRFNLLIDVIEGLLIGFGLTLIFFGIIFQEYDLLRFINHKKNSNNRQKIK